MSRKGEELNEKSSEKLMASIPGGIRLEWVSCVSSLGESEAVMGVGVVEVVGGKKRWRRSINKQRVQGFVSPLGELRSASSNRTPPARP